MDEINEEKPEEVEIERSSITVDLESLVRARDSTQEEIKDLHAENNKFRVAMASNTKKVKELQKELKGLNGQIKIAKKEAHKKLSQIK